MADPETRRQGDLCSPAAGIFIHGSGHSGAVVNFYKLAKAILTSDFQLLGHLLERGLDPDSRDEEGNTPLMIAVKEGNEKAVRILISRGADTNACNGLNESPLRMAAWAGDPWMAKVLVKNGADPNIADAKKDTALIQAVKLKNTEIVHILIRAGANINATDQYGLTAVSYAVSSGVVELVETLLQAGGNPNALDRYRCNSLIRATDAGKDDIVRALLKFKVQVHAPNKYGDTALIFASQFCQVSTVHLLLEAGSEINHKNDRGLTALHLAADRGRADVIRALVSGGADVNAQKIDSCTAIMCGARRSCEVVKELIKANAQLNLVDCSGHTALLMAATWGTFETVVALVEAGADVNILTKDGETAVMSAARFNRNRAVKYLLQSGARTDVVHKDGSLNTVLTYASQFCLLETVLLLLQSRTQEELLIAHANAQGHTALTYACTSDKPELLSRLIGLGLNVNTRTVYSDTPLILASQYSSLGAVKCLIKAGANVNAANKLGVTPLLNAVKRDRKEIVHALLQGRAEILTELHLATLHGYKGIVQIMMQNGASPRAVNVQILFDEINSRNSHRRYWSPLTEQGFPPLGTIHTPLSIALISGHWDIAKYFLHNWFMTYSDCVRLPFESELRHYLILRNMGECLQIMDAMSAKPWRLLLLSFSVVSTSAGHGQDRALKIQEMKLPPLFERRLQFRDKTAFQFPSKWEDFSVNEIC